MAANFRQVTSVPTPSTESADTTPVLPCSAVYITYLILIAISVVFFYMVYRHGKKKMM